MHVISYVFVLVIIAFGLCTGCTGGGGGGAPDPTFVNGEGIGGQKPVVTAFNVQKLNDTTLKIEVTGTGFQAGATVNVKTKDCTDVQVASALQLNCVLHEVFPFVLKDIVVKNPDGLNSEGTTSGTASFVPWTGTKIISLPAEAVGMYFAGGLIDSRGDFFSTGEIGPAEGAMGLRGVLVKTSNSGEVLWSSILASPGEEVMGNYVANDAGGNTYLAGYTGGPLDGGPEYGVGSSDSFLTKYNSQGQKQWTRQNGTPTIQSGAGGLVITPSGDAVVAHMGGTWGITNIGYMDAQLMKYDSSGNRLWANSILGMTDRSTNVLDLATDGEGNFYMAGITYGSPSTFEGQPFNYLERTYIAKVSPSGQRLWVRFLPSVGLTNHMKLVIDNSGALYMSGGTDVSLTGSPFIGQKAGFLLKYDSAGTSQWIRQWGVTNEVTLGTTVALKNGVIYVAGFTSGGLDGNVKSGTEDMFISKYDLNGNRAWTRQLGGPGITRVKPITVGIDSSNEVLISATTTGPVDGNPAPPLGTQSIIGIKYNPQGVKQ